MASLFRLASLAILFAAAQSLPRDEPRDSCGSNWACTEDMGAPLALNMSTLCSPTGPDYCNLGAYMVPRTVLSVNDNGGTPSRGNVDLYIFNNYCNQIGNLASAFSLSNYNSSLVAFDSELAEVVAASNFNPPDGYGNNANLQSSYSTWTSPPLWNNGDDGYIDELNNSHDHYCWPTQTSTGATWLQIRFY